MGIQGGAKIGQGSPYSRIFFFRPEGYSDIALPVHVCAVTYITEISLHVTLSNQSHSLTLICRDIFNFSSETAKRNSTRLRRKQDLNVPYQVCVFRADRKKTKLPPLPYNWLRRKLYWKGGGGYERSTGKWRG